MNDGHILWSLVPSAILWSLWKGHNNRIFKGSRHSFDDRLNGALLYTVNWVPSRIEYQNLHLHDIIHNWVPR